MRAREWVAARYESLHGLPVAFAPCPTAEWSKGAAANPVVAASDADLIVLADADSYVPAEHLTAAIEHAREVGWCRPHDWVKRIGRDDSARIIAGEDVPRPRLQRDVPQSHYRALPGGGIVVLTRETWDAVPLDPRFIGWGGEDASWGLALQCLIDPPCSPGARRVLWHLWHPAPNGKRQISPASRALGMRYRAARRDPDAMRQLIEEARNAAHAAPV